MANDPKKNVSKGLKGVVVGAIATTVGVITSKMLANALNLDPETESGINAAIATLVSGLVLGYLNYAKNVRK